MATLTVANCQIVCTIEGLGGFTTPVQPFEVPDGLSFTLQPSTDLETLDALDILLSPPRTCLSCGAKTNTAGELPCGH
ncbi:hypothetical protein [Herbaspirillum sp. CAH-3]|uniref:hypothetical protein n=1 Tax=Herbaspirillum sp. CAH-3 TaxID=2605746 RepID=UPI0012ACF0A0|nr:hypothetical protein [Herbaspirillum sp. CAH-3]MRT30869.1 hypothetical protein [Herbaspirillum sp. CAH-3]